MQVAPDRSNQTGRGLRQVVLSSFAGEKALGLLEKRRDEYAARVLLHQQTLQNLTSDHQKALSEAKNALFRLRLAKAIQMWIRSERIDDDIRRIRDCAPIVPSASIDELQARAGDEAERRLDEYLLTCLDAKWTLISGYMGHSGEIDRILVGPWGIYAFEVKGDRGVACSDGSRWWMEKTNRRGDHIHTKTLSRAPDAQLNKAVKWLAGWLGRNKIDLPITRVVLFTAPDARIGAVNDADVDFVTTLREMDLGYLFDPLTKGGALAPEECERIVGLILRDHSFCEKRRRKMGTSEDGGGNDANTQASRRDDQHPSGHSSIQTRGLSRV